MADKVILGADGKPTSVVDNDGKRKPAPKLPKPEDARLYFEIARAVLYAEQMVFEKADGSTSDKLKAARDSYIEAGHKMRQEDLLQKRIWLAPHLFAEVMKAVPQPGVATVRIRCKDVRDEFKVMALDGYVGMPVLGLGPSEILKQMTRDKRAGKGEEDDGG